MELFLLGPVEATLDGRPVPLGATKQRAVLALRANETVSLERLVDGLWGEEPPPAAKMVQRLRRLLADVPLVIDRTVVVTSRRAANLRFPAYCPIRSRSAEQGNRPRR
jgi:DNA-binding SARP family transcriptional activator